MSDLEDDNEPIEMVDDNGESIEAEASAEAEVEETDDDQQEAQTSDDSDDTEAEESDDSEDEVEEEPDDDAIKAHNAEMAQRRIAEREARRQQEAALLQAQREYVEEAESDAQRLVREIETERYNQQVKSVESSILTDFERIKADQSLQMFNPESKEFRPELFAELQDTFEKAHTQVDQWGNVVGLNASFYDKAKSWGAIWNKQAKISEAKASTNLKKSMAKAEPGSDSGQRPAKNKDPLMEILLSD